MKLRVEYNVSVGLIQTMLAHHLSQDRKPPRSDKALRSIISEYLRLDGFNVQKTLRVNNYYLGKAITIIDGFNKPKESASSLPKKQA